METDPRPGCPTCGFHELLTVTMKPHGETISFTHCNACGWKRWGREIARRRHSGRGRRRAQAIADKGRDPKRVGQGGYRGPNSGARRR